MKTSTPQLLERGRGLFNAGRFFEAHEIWEEAWLGEEGDIRVLLQGLIQIAAALLKASRAERPGGCAQLLDAGLAKLEPAEGDLAGLDLMAFRRSVEDFRTGAAAWLSGQVTGLRPASFPELHRATNP
jgi:uncharacterized protein